MIINEPPCSLTNEQFEKLVRFIDAAACVAVNRAVQENRKLRDVAEQGYVNDKEAARRALVIDPKS